MTINAFSPSYVQTHMPEFLHKIRAESAAKMNGDKSSAKARATRENIAEQNTASINHFPKTKRVSLAPTEFFTYAKAGMPKGIK